MYLDHVTTKPKLVVLNGWGFYRIFWQHLFQLLCASFRVKLIDVCAYMSADKFDLAVATIAGEFIDNDYVLGWSLGAQVAITLALRYPLKVKKIVTFAFNPCFVSQSNWNGMDAKDLYDFYVRFKLYPQQILKYFYRLQLRGSRQKPDFNALAPEINFSLQQQNLVTLIRGLEFLYNNDLRSELLNLKQKVLHIYGAKDQIVPCEVGYYLQDNCSSLVEIVRGAGHACFYTHANLVADIIVQFFYE